MQNSEKQRILIVDDATENIDILGDALSDYKKIKEWWRSMARKPLNHMLLRQERQKKYIEKYAKIFQASPDAIGYISKPIDTRTFSETVARFLD